jgi:hypothetical protein
MSLKERLNRFSSRGSPCPPAASQGTFGCPCLRSDTRFGAAHIEISIYDGRCMRDESPGKLSDRFGSGFSALVMPVAEGRTFDASGRHLDAPHQVSRRTTFTATF